MGPKILIPFTIGTPKKIPLIWGPITWSERPFSLMAASRACCSRPSACRDTGVVEMAGFLDAIALTYWSHPFYWFRIREMQALDCSCFCTSASNEDRSQMLTEVAVLLLLYTNPRSINANHQQHHHHHEVARNDLRKAISPESHLTRNYHEQHVKNPNFMREVLEQEPLSELKYRR